MNECIYQNAIKENIYNLNQHLALLNEMTEDGGDYSSSIKGHIQQLKTVIDAYASIIQSFSR